MDVAQFMISPCSRIACLRSLQNLGDLSPYFIRTALTYSNTGSWRRPMPTASTWTNPTFVRQAQRARLSARSLPSCRCTPGRLIPFIPFRPLLPQPSRPARRLVFRSPPSRTPSCPPLSAARSLSYPLLPLRLSSCAHSLLAAPRCPCPCPYHARTIPVPTQCRCRRQRQRQG